MAPPHQRMKLASADTPAALRVVEDLGFRFECSGDGGGSRWHDFALVSPDRLGAP